MNKDEIIADLNKIIATLKGEEKKEEKKEQRKLIDVFDSVMKPGSVWFSVDMAKATIDAVIECYEEWEKIYAKPFVTIKFKPFPEYLKEKML